MNYQAPPQGLGGGCGRAWREALVPQQSPSTTMPWTGTELVGDDVIENRLLASRMALTVTEHVARPLTSRASVPSTWTAVSSSRDILRP